MKCDLQCKSQEAAGFLLLLSCREGERERKNLLKGHLQRPVRSYHIYSLLNLEKVSSWFVFFVCKEGRCRWAPSWQFQGHRKATLSLAPYISHLGCLSGQRLSLKLYMKTNWFRKRSQECYSLTEFLFSADTITGSNSQPSLGCRVSILPVAPQSYFFVQSCSLLSSAKWSGPFCLKWGKDITKTYGVGTLIKQGKC